ncbi:MAG: sugar phosphate isomerase/epimerase [Deltaproteobacteria bacterium]|nr:sugar phosphate isomerase/epimerase [Deltaproteobacteria bacterium]
MTQTGVAAVEVAPTKVWASPLSASADEVKRYRGLWEERGISIAAMQALLFGRPDLVMFSSDGARRDTLEYLRGMIRLASLLGATVLVFGSPKNRIKGALSNEEADAIAVPFFRALGQEAHEHGVCLCIEPNAPEYGCDYVTDCAQGMKLVRKVGHPGFGLHLDAACMTLVKDDPLESFAGAGGHLRHFHISEPWLGRIGSGGVDHKGFSRALKESGYGNLLSIEMKALSGPDNAPNVRAALEFSIRQYLGAG